MEHQTFLEASLEEKQEIITHLRSYN